MSDLSKEIRKHLAHIPKHLQKRPNGQRLLAAAEEIEALEAKLAEFTGHGHRHAHHDQTRNADDESEKR